MEPDPSLSAPPPLAGLRQWTRLEVPPRAEAVADATARLRMHLAAQGARAEALDQLQLAVSEALNNAIEHGGPARQATPAELCWLWEGDWVEIAVSEEGYFAPPESWTALPFALQAEGGRGGFLIKESVDELRHENQNGRHTLRMRKRLGPAALPSSTEELHQVLDAMTEELSATYESLAVLLRVGEALATAENLSQFLEGVLAAGLRERVPFDTSCVRLGDGAGNLTVLRKEAARQSGIPESLPAAAADVLEMRVFREGQERTIVSRAALPPQDPLWRATGCAFVCPIRFHGRMLGVLTIARNGGTDYFTAGQLGLLRAVAEFVGIAHAHAEMQAQRRQQELTLREIEIARQIQDSLLPRNFPVRTDWNIHGLCRNAAAVGGDFFDVREIADQGVQLVIADVMGKGLPAALLAAMVRTALRGHPELAAQPGELLTEVNRELAADLQRLGMFITVQVVFLPAGGGGRVIYASAGHGPILAQARPGAAPEFLSAGGLPLGVTADERYVGGEQPVSAGLKLLLMTDGVYEVEGREGEQFGLLRVVESMRHHWRRRPEEFCAHLLAETAAFSPNQANSDDSTLLAAQFLQ